MYDPKRSKAANLPTDKVAHFYVPPVRQNHPYPGPKTRHKPSTMAFPGNPSPITLLNMTSRFRYQNAIILADYMHSLSEEV